jgi:hypothetical protein
MLSRRINVSRIFGLLVVKRSEHLLMKNFREADDGIERRAQFMTTVPAQLHFTSLAPTPLQIEHLAQRCLRSILLSRNQTHSRMTNMTPMALDAHGGQRVHAANASITSYSGSDLL